MHLTYSYIGTIRTVAHSEESKMYYFTATNIGYTNINHLICIKIFINTSKM